MRAALLATGGVGSERGRDPLQGQVVHRPGSFEGERADRAAAAGPRPLHGVESLTPSERRVAGMAADGTANKVIAQTLYVAPKTVELHLSSAYRKLRIRSRRELPAALVPR